MPSLIFFLSSILIYLTKYTKLFFFAAIWTCKFADNYAEIDISCFYTKYIIFYIRAMSGKSRNHSQRQYVILHNDITFLWNELKSLIGALLPLRLSECPLYLPIFFFFFFTAQRPQTEVI